MSIALPPDVQVPLAVRAAAAGKHLLLEKPIALNVADADRPGRRPCSDAGVASVVFFTFRFLAATSTWLAQAARTSWPVVPARGSARCAGSPFDASPWRDEHGALWDIGPHALSLLVPALGPVVSVQAGAGLRDTVHLVLHARVGRRLDGLAVAHGGADVVRHRVLRARGRRPAGAAARGRRRGRGVPRSPSTSSSRPR